MMLIGHRPALFLSPPVAGLVVESVGEPVFSQDVGCEGDSEEVLAPLLHLLLKDQGHERPLEVQVDLLDGQAVAVAVLDGDVVEGEGELVGVEADGWLGGEGCQLDGGRAKEPGGVRKRELWMGRETT